MALSCPEKNANLVEASVNEETTSSSIQTPEFSCERKPPRSASFVVLLTLLMSAPRRVICVCLQPWPPFLPHRAAPWAPCFLRNTWSVLECSPVTLCLNDRHRSPECMRWPRGSTKRAAFPPGPLAAETVRYCPPARGKAGLCMCRHPFPAQTVRIGVLSFFRFVCFNKIQTVTVICKEFQIFEREKYDVILCLS